MQITLTDLMNYVFGDGAKPRASREGVILTAEQQARKKAAEEESRQTIKSLFNAITEQPDSSLLFRNLLRTQNNTQLEELLYKNTSDPIVDKSDSDQYNLPSDTDITAHFKKLDQEYGYFSTNKNASSLFIKLFKTCKLVADYLEKNNSIDNAVAYLHAYKLMVFFNIKPKQSFETIEHFIAQHGLRFEKPIHDTLVLPIPKNNPPLKYIEQWQRLIQQYGMTVLPLFQQAHKIEKILDEQTLAMTLESVQEAASQIIYRNAAKNPELAKLSLQYHLSEADFEKCLTIKPKESDQLPNVIVAGNELAYPEYYMVKLPADDPRAYILGHMTNCCQSIGGHSERCVIDGITRQHNGFYVLLKIKPDIKTAATSTPLHQGKINYDQFEIVGQGYLWWSTMDNLTFDSWENLTPSRDDKVIISMLPQFAKQCFEQNPNIGQLTIGRGGKTPNSYSKCIANSEIMAEGTPYQDSNHQISIAINPALLHHAAQINTLFQEKGVDFTPAIFSFKQLPWFNWLLTEYFASTDQDTLVKKNHEQLLKFALSEHSLVKLVTDIYNTSCLETKKISFISEIEYYRFRMFFLLENLEKSTSVMIYQDCLNLIANPELINTSIRTPSELLLQINPNLRFMTEILEWVNAHPELITDEIYMLVKDYNQSNSDTLSLALSTLKMYHRHRALITYDVIKLLLKNAEYANHIAKGLIELHSSARTNENYDKLMNEFIFNLIADKKESAPDAAEALSHLNAMSSYGNQGLMSDKNCQFVISKKVINKAEIVINIMSCLYRDNGDLINDENRELLANLSHPYEVLALLHALDRLERELNITLITDANFKLIAENAEYAEAMKDKLEEDLENKLHIIAETSPELNTDDYLKKMCREFLLTDDYFKNLITTVSAACATEQLNDDRGSSPDSESEQSNAEADELEQEHQDLEDQKSIIQPDEIKAHKASITNITNDYKTKLRDSVQLNSSTEANHRPTTHIIQSVAKEHRNNTSMHITRDASLQASRDDREGVTTEEDCRQLFLATHNQLFSKDKAGFFGKLRRTKVSENDSLGEILERAKDKNNRSRKVCIELGWMNKDGTLSAKAPEPVVNQYPNDKKGSLTPHARQ